METSVRKRFGLFLIMYILSYGFIVFNHGVFWDDSGLIGMDKKAVLEWQSMAGLPWIGYLEIILANIGVTGYRIISLICFFISSICCYFILKKHSDLFTEYDCFFITAFFALFPVFTDRILVIIGWYTIPYLLFYFGWFILMVYFNNKKILLRILALFLFFMSFAHNSFLVFYVLVLIDILYVSRKEIKNFVNLMTVGLKYLDFILLPLMARFIQTMFKPYGLYKNYNKVTLNSAIKGIKLSVHSIMNSFIGTLLKISDLGIAMILIGFLLGGLFYFAIGRSKINLKENMTKNLLLFLFGVLSLFIAVYPYSAVGKVSKNVDWLGRWQLLIPLGASLTIYFGFKLLCRTIQLGYKSLAFICCCSMSFFIIMNFHYYSSYQMDYYKQLSLLNKVNSSKILRSHTTFLFKDETSELNAKDRHYRFYEYNWLMKTAFGNTKRLGVPKRMGYDKEKLKRFRKYKNYNFYQYKFIPPQYVVTIKHGSYNPAIKHRYINWLYLQLFHHQQFIHKINHIIKLDYKKIPS